jgi:nucleoside-diphosphate-sugar epimerase
LRLAHVYGDYDSKFVGTQLALARVYQYLEQELKWLWTKDLRVNTVHVTDTARALWAAAEWYAQGKKNWDANAYGPTPIFNIVDNGNSSQGTFSSIIGETFKIETGFQGQIISTFARLNLDSVVDDVNDETLGPWADLLEEAKITRPGPLSPFMEKELLKDTDLSLDGRRFEQVVGFTYEKPKITKEEVESIIESYKRMNWWP